MADMNDYMRKIHLPHDARSSRGIFSRGRNVYRGGVPQAKTARLGNAALKRLRSLK